MIKNNRLTKIILFIILVILMVFIPNCSKAFTTGYYDYTIEKYDVNMVVNQNNTFDITETITANFNVSKHGIFRKIPLKNNVIRLDGTKSKNTAQITNISVSDSFKTYNENGYKVIKIGSANKTLQGTNTYTIKYNYNIGKDTLKNADELYFNLIGTEWDAPISNISFKIVMPKEFDKNLLGFSTGKTGSTYNSNVKYTVNNKTITGSVTNTLNPGEGLTVRLELPNKYFIGAGNKVDALSIFTIVLSVFFVFISYKIWHKYAKDEPIIETVEFYPPEGYNSAEIGYLYHGENTTESVISLLVYLANKGYLKIEETEESDITGKGKVMKIIKLKEYDGDNDNEMEFFNGLFSQAGSILEKAENIQESEKLKGNEISWEEAKEKAKNDLRTYVTTLELKGNFYNTIDNIEENISKEFKHKINEKTIKPKKVWLIIMAIVLSVIVSIKPMSLTDDYEATASVLTLQLAIFPVILSIIHAQKDKSVTIVLIIWGIIMGVIPWAFVILPLLVQVPFYLLTYILGSLSMYAIVWFSKNMHKKTKWGAQILGKILGFKRFLETAEKEQLESLVMDNPEYFYNILPYTYALEVSDKWIKQFETIAIQEPTWYHSNGTFNIDDFGDSINTTIKSMKYSSSSGGSGSSSSSSSGGGSSGGGSGGGGGGSW